MSFVIQQQQPACYGADPLHIVNCYRNVDTASCKLLTINNTQEH